MSRLRGVERAVDVEAWLRTRADEMLELVEALVACPTENPPGSDLGACGRLLHDATSALGLESTLLEPPPADNLQEPLLVRAVAGDGSETIYYHGHFDVVPAQSPEQFKPRRENGAIVGRGTADMKGGLVSMLYGAAAARDLGLLGDTKVVLHFVCDEETGSTSGSGYLRANELIDPGALAMLTAEPTGGVVWHANRGAITMRVDVRGREAHVGQAHLGDNAFEKMTAVAQPLLALSHDLLAHESMLVVGGSSGAGASFNAVPGNAWFSVDRRFNPDEDLNEEVERLTAVLEQGARDTGADIAVEVVQTAPSARSDPTSAAGQALARCISAVEGTDSRFELCPGVLETRWYAQLGIPAFAYGPGRLEVSHGPDERLDLSAMLRCAAVYALLPRALEG
jgi:succinyl-diaminopimelate desuccinylase